VDFSSVGYGAYGLYRILWHFVSEIINKKTSNLSLSLKYEVLLSFCGDTRIRPGILNVAI
jgi:hypothetical protein